MADLADLHNVAVVHFFTEAHSVHVKMCVSKMSHISYNYDSIIK